MERSRLLLPWLSLAFCWLVFFHALYKGKQRNALAFTACPDQDAVVENLKLHFTGILWMGLIPVLLYKTVLSYLPDPFGIVKLWKLNGWILIPSLVAALAGYIQSRKRPANSSLPATERDIIIYSCLRILYIISYELFFRGWVLFESIKVLSPVPAIVLNMVLYFLSHFFADRNERTGTVLLGPVLCLVSLSTGSVLGAVMIHLALTISYEVPLLYFRTNTSKKIL